MAPSRQLDLFLLPAHGPSDSVREYVADYALEDRVQPHDLGHAEARARWQALGGHTAPALWDGTHLHQGAEAVRARLQAVVNLGRDMS